MVEDSQIVGFTYLELVWLIRNTTLVKEFWTKADTFLTS
jgi:hypothetical protein